MSWPRLGILPTLFICMILTTLLAWPVGLVAHVNAAPLVQEDQAAITFPQANSDVTGTIQVTGSATHPQFLRYELAWASEPGDNWTVFASIEAPIENGILGTWNTTQVPDGRYSLRLRVVRQDSNYTEIVVRGINVVNSQPVETPTQSVGPTIPPEPTGVLTTPTPELIIQPPTSTPQPPTPTPASGGAAGSDTPLNLNPTSFSVNFGAVGEAFCNGALYALGVFVLWGAVLGVRGIARWALRRMQKPSIQ